MRTPRAVLAAALSASLCAPASAQVRVAAAMAGSAVPRVMVSMPVSAPSWTGTPSLSNLSAPSAAPSSFSAAWAAPIAAPALAAAPAASVHLPAAVRRAAAPVLKAVAAAALPESGVSSERAAAPEGAEAARARAESFWSGAASRPETDGVVPASPPATPAPGLSAPRALTRAAGAAAVLTPAAHGVASAWSHVAPYAEAGAVLAGAWAVNRGANWLLGKVAAKRGLDRHQVAVVRLVSSVVLWTAAVAAALHFGGAPAELTATVFGAGGTILTLGLKDVLGNLIQGVNFLVTRPYTLGARVTIDEQTGTVSDLSLSGITVLKDDGSEVKIRHAALAAKPVILLGEYRFPDSSLRLGRPHLPAKPRFDGVAGAVWSSLGRGFWLSAGALAALLLAPHFVAAMSAGWIGTLVHWALAASVAWTTERIAAGLAAAADKLAERNGWRVEARVMARLAVRVAAWAVGGGVALRTLGVSWTALGASVGVTTLGVGLASNNFFGAVVQGGAVLFSKPFSIGDRVKAGAFEGVVEDMTLYHVVVRLDEGRHALIPYAVVRDAALVVTHPKETKK